METMRCQPEDRYPGVLKPGFRPFDPVHLAAAIERAVCNGNLRKYSRFGDTINYQTGIATGYVVGCCLRCIYCWASETRDRTTTNTQFFSPQEVFEQLTDIAKRKKLNQIRISDGEPTIGKQHLLELLELVERSTFHRFVLETNGILLGCDDDYVRSVSKFRKCHVRISLKAGTPDHFTRKTGAMPEAFELPFQAIRSLKTMGVSLGVAAMSADPRFMSPLERVSLISKIADIDPALVLNLEEEVVVLYPDTRKRLKAMGWDLDGGTRYKLHKIPLLNRFIQVSYYKLPVLSRKKLAVGYTLKAIRELYHAT